MDANKNEQVEMTPFMKQGHLKGQTKRSRNCLRNLSLYFSQYCDATSIHGIKYVGQRGRYMIEKLLWLIIVIGIFTICSILIYKTYRKWKTSPVIVSFSTTEMSISEIPFPAVTICPEAKFDPEIFNFTDHLLARMMNTTDPKEGDYLFDTLATVCNSIHSFAEIIDANDATKLISNVMLIGFMAALPELDPHNITDMKFRGSEVTVDDFSYTLTSEGLCYSFNMLPYEEIVRDGDELISQKNKARHKVQKWTLDDGYPSKDDFDTYPRRTFLAGIEGGLEISGLFTNHSYLDFLCAESLQGFKVALHHPCELPNMDKHIRLPLDEAVFVGIKPKMITVSNDLISYAAEDRKCFFGHEKYLSLYSYYTQDNCLSECLTNYTLAQCGCVAFHMPVSSTSEMCGLGNIECLRNSKLKFLENETDNNGLCNCLPSCTSLSYEVETSQARWDWPHVFQVFQTIGLTDFFPDAKQSHFSRLNVYYKELQFLNSERNELYGYVDFFSNVGGLLGLFIGLSVTSCIEILYFLSLRVVCNIKKYGRRVWSGEPDLINGSNE